MPLFGLGKYGGAKDARKEARFDRKKARFDERQAKMEDVIGRLREKQKTSSPLSNFVSGRNRKIQIYDMVKNAKK